jgi:hypothetical protein
MGQPIIDQSNGCSPTASRQIHAQILEALRDVVNPAQRDVSKPRFS